MIQRKKFYQKKLVVLIMCILLALTQSSSISNKRKKPYNITHSFLQSVNLSRQKIIQEKCKQIPLKYRLETIPSELFYNILIDRKHKFLYCYVPKVASTNWKRVFMVLVKKWRNTNPLLIPSSLPHRGGMFEKLNNVNLSERDYIVKHYQKMIVVRNPFERILSAFRNKMLGNTESAKEFQKTMGRHIIKFYRTNASKTSLKLGNDVTFKEFATMLTERPAKLRAIVKNEHWHPIMDLCHPCLLNYTLVGKYETLYNDAQLALHAINATYIKFPKKHRPETSSKIISQYFSQLGKTLFKKLYKVYEQDFQIFHYTSPLDELKNVTATK